MKTKGEVSSIFHTFHRMVQTQFGASIKVLRYDNGREYISSQLQKYLTECGIIHQTLCVHTPQQHGVVEWKKPSPIGSDATALIWYKRPKNLLV